MKAIQISYRTNINDCLNIKDDLVPEELILSMKLKFISKKAELIYRIYKRPQKRIILMVLLILSIIALGIEIVDSFIHPSALNVFNTAGLGGLVLAFSLQLINLALKRSRYIQIGNNVLYLILVVGLSACAWKVKNTNLSNATVSVSSLVYVSEAVFALPLILGSFLDIDILVLLFSQSCLVACQFIILNDYEQAKRIHVLFLKVQFVVGAVLSFVAVYTMIRNERIAFIQRQGVKSQEQSKLKNQHQIVEAKGRYIAQVAHDIGTPLATFSLAVELLQSHADTIEMRDILETAQCAIELMTVTRREALDHAKHLDGIELRPSLKEVQLREIIRRCARLIQHPVGHSNFKVEFYLDSFLPEQIFTDYDWIWTMLTNFLSNAQKYSNKGKIVTTMYEVEPSMLRVEVADEGIGVPADRIHLLFKPFAQLMKSAGGTGLGLHGVYMKAQALGGSVGVRENPASTTGSTFFFEIPCVAVSDDHVHQAVPFAESILFIGKWPESILQECRAFLQKRFVRVHCVESHDDYRTRMTPEHAFYAYVFWFLDADMMECSTQSLVNIASWLKGQISQQKTNGKKCSVYVTSQKQDSSGHTLPQQYSNNENPMPEMTSEFKPPYTPSKDQSQSNSLKMTHESSSKDPRSPKFQLVKSNDLKWPGAQDFNEITDRSFSLKRKPTWSSKRRDSLECAGGDCQKYPTQEEDSGARVRPLLGVSKIEQVVNESKVGFVLRDSLTGNDIKSLVLQSDTFRVDTLPKAIHPQKAKANYRSTPKHLHQKENQVEFFARSSVDDSAVSEISKGFNKDSEITVLVVDDESSILKFVTKMLEKNGYYVTSRTNGFEALMLLKARQFGVLIIDLNMPVMDGLECIRRFREWELAQLSASTRRVRQPIIVLSANACRSHVEESLATGADEFVAKPVKINDLIETILKVQHRGTPELETEALSDDPDQDYNSEFTPSIRTQLSMHKTELMRFSQDVCNRKRLLVVDDNQMLVKMSEKLLEKRGYEVTTGLNGTEALQLMTDPNYHFDAVIIDHQMPVMDGLECISRFRRWEEAIQKTKGGQENSQLAMEERSKLENFSRRGRQKIILLSGGDFNFDKDLGDKAVLKKIDKILVKPVNYDRLVEFIEKEQIQSW